MLLYGDDHRHPAFNCPADAVRSRRQSPAPTNDLDCCDRPMLDPPSRVRGLPSTFWTSEKSRPPEIKKIL
jgi:hypothetical protein